MATAIGNLEDMLFFPYYSVPDEFGAEDREYDDQDWADYFRQFIGNGVFPNPSNGLKIESIYGSMVLTVRTGAGFINGRLYLQKKDFQFSVTPAHLTLGRRDIVVCRHDALNRTTQVIYIEGTPSSLPVVPPIVRTDDIYDLKLCEITINPNAQAITQANILDTRLNSAVCGIVHGMIDQVDTTAIFGQYQTYINEQLAKWNAIQAAEESNWRNQTDRQESDWRKEMDVMAEFYDEMRLLYLSLETQSFTLINNNFDDWSVRRGCVKTTEFNADNTILEKITVIALDFLLAKKLTTFNEDGGITEAITFYPREFTEGSNTINTTAFTLSKKTVFNADGNITETIS